MPTPLAEMMENIDPDDPSTFCFLADQFIPHELVEAIENGTIVKIGTRRADGMHAFRLVHALAFGKIKGVSESYLKGVSKDANEIHS